MPFRFDNPPLCLFALLVSLTAAAAAGAAETQTASDSAAGPLPAATTDQAAGRPAAAVLPAPLDKVVCNIAGLEQSGHLVLTDVKLGRSEDFGDEALIWTVKVQQPISCRHVTILLRRFSDVRFYYNEEETQKELYSTDLLYASRVAEGAVHGEILGQDEEFQIWVLLSLRHVDMLASLKADTVVFHKPQTVRVRPLSATRWNAAESALPRWFSKRQEPHRMP